MTTKFNKKPKGARDGSIRKVYNGVNGTQRRRSASPGNRMDLNLSFSNDSKPRNSQSSLNVETQMSEDNDESSSDDVGLFNTTVFKNNKKSSNEPVRHLFEIQKVKTGKKSTYQGTCSLCDQVVKMGNNSDINLRSHLAFIHERIDLLTEGQKASSKFGKDKNEKLNPEEKSKIDEAVLECIYIDSRSFNDFIKPGMRKLFKILKPGYKPMSKQTVRNRHKMK